MAKQFLERAQVRAARQQVRREAVAERVGRRAFRKAKAAARKVGCTPSRLHKPPSPLDAMLCGVSLPSLTILHLSAPGARCA